MTHSNIPPHRPLEMHGNSQHKREGAHLRVRVETLRGRSGPFAADHALAHSVNSAPAIMEGPWKQGWKPGTASAPLPAPCPQPPSREMACGLFRAQRATTANPSRRARSAATRPRNTPQRSRYIYPSDSGRAIWARAAAGFLRIDGEGWAAAAGISSCLTRLYGHAHGRPR